MGQCISLSLLCGYNEAIEMSAVDVGNDFPIICELFRLRTL